MRNFHLKRCLSIKVRAVSILLMLLIYPAVGHSQPTCDAPALSDAEVKSAIDRARATRADLPAPFVEYQWSVKKRGCYYVYIEFPIPAVMDSNHMITLNQHGTIVNVLAQGQLVKLQCPDKVFTENELAEIIRTEREKRVDLPPPFTSYEVLVQRLGCLYFYTEYTSPEIRKNYKAFKIDPYGELMEFFLSQP